LTLFSRAGTSREATDAAVAALEIHELPSARGCTYVVPKTDFGLALQVGQGFGNESDMRTARKLGVTDAEIEKLGEVVLKALRKGPLDPEQLREAGGGTVRNLGPEGVKKGVATTLPLALGGLQSAGRIRRIPMDGRLDRQRYRYALWEQNPLRSLGLSQEEAMTELGRRFFRWIGPATAAEFQRFSGLGVKATKTALDPLGLVPLERESELLLTPEDRQALSDFKPPREARYALVSSLDGILQHRRELEMLVAKEDADRKVAVEKGTRTISSIGDLPSHAILDRGRLVGLWEFDPATNSIAWMSFIASNRELEKAVRRTEDYIAGELGDARSFSLDSPKSRAPRIEAIRKSSSPNRAGD
jgi:hypothetical protein